MKIALLITGQLRTYSLCKHVIKNTLLDKYEVDTFLSIDKSNFLTNDDLNSHEYSNESMVNDVIQFFNPCDTFVCNSYDEIFKEKLKHINKKILQCTDVNKLQLIFEQYFIVYKAYELLINHINHTGKKYDLVIRLRFDQFIWSESSNALSKYIIRNSRGNKVILFSEENTENVRETSENLKIEIDIPKMNEIYVFGFSNRHWVNDQFWIHSHDKINVMSSYYESLHNIMNEAIHTNTYPTNNEPWIEVFFYRFLYKHNFEIKKSKIIGEFCREIYL